MEVDVNENVKKPKVRFKGYEDAWEQRKLGDVCSRVQGNDGRMELPTLTISAGNGWMRQEDRFSGNIAGKEQRNYTLLHRGELSYNHGNSKLAKYGAVFSLQTYEEALVPRVYHSFKVENGDADFVEYYFATKLPDKELGKLISSGARMDGLLNIGYEEFMGIPFLFPNEEEQSKISSYFRTLDHLITLHQRECEQAKKYKKYMLQKMFPQNGSNVPEIRFSGFTHPWEQRKLGDVVEVCSGCDYKHLDAGDIPVYGTGGYMLSVSEALSYDEDAIGIGRKGTIDKPYVLKAPFWTVDTLFYCVPKEKYDLNFAFDLFQTINWKTMDESTGVPSLSKTIINKVEILAPTLPEQQKIGRYFNKLDNLITLHQQKCEELQKIKKFMLQNMFV